VIIIGTRMLMSEPVRFFGLRSGEIEADIGGRVALGSSTHRDIGDAGFGDGVAPQQQFSDAFEGLTFAICRGETTHLFSGARYVANKLR
jgi:hypothetical protein